MQKVLLEEIMQISDPLVGAASSEESFKRFFHHMGWNFDENIGMDVGSLVPVIHQISELIEHIHEMIDEEEMKSLDQVLVVLNAIEKLFENVGKLAGAFDGANMSKEVVLEIFQDISHHLLIRYLEKEHYVLTAVLRFISVIQVKTGDETIFNSSGKIIRHPYAYEVINFSNLGKFITNPPKAINDIYFASFDRTTVAGARAFTDQLFPKLGWIAEALGATAVYGIKPLYEVDFGEVGNEMAAGALTIEWRTPLDEFNFGFTLAYSPKEWGDLGWVIVPFGELTLDEILGNYLLTIKSTLQVGGIIISDKGDVSFDTDNGLAKVAAELLALKADTETGLAYVIGEKEGTRLEIGTISVGSSFDATTAGVDFDVHFNIEEAKFIISGKGQDGFMAKILPKDGIEVPFDFLLGYSSQKSLYFGANAGLELALPVHVDVLGILKANEIYLKIKANDKGLKGEASLSGKADLGPLMISFNEVGMQTQLNWSGSEKNLGFGDLSFGFKPPSGLGLSINTGAVVGGGYLFFDPEREEYAGVLELTIAGFVSAKAIGLITTKMPDGSKGFSMLIIISAEFNPPFQLGFGFTLMGVGGLLGLNRTVLLDPLREGIRTGAANSIMFPQNVIANAPRIISDLKTIFPSYEGKFLVGPMGKLGWGTPTLISLSLGLIIEIPGKLAILGVLKIALPDEKVPLVKIQVAFLGAIDFNKKLLTFDASLFESSLLGMTLEGDMAVRMKWGDQPDFLLSVGGFHPSYTPPPLALPTLRRLAINILNTSIAKIRVECYQAVTSNTVQFGAKAEVYFDLKACSINGHIAFDALFQFSPFYFMIQLSSGFSMKVVGLDMLSVRVKMSLEGPTPWRAKGTGKVSLLFFSVSANFDKTWGDKKDTSLPSIEILPRFIKELQKKEQWNTLLASNKTLFVSLRKLEETAVPALVLHPSGTLVVQQRLLPLSVAIDRIGNQKTSDVKKVVISKAVSGSISLVTTPVDEYFARAQYQQLSDAEKLSKPSFEKMPGGVAITMGKSHIENGKMVRKKVEYEVTIVDKVPRKPFKFGVFFAEIAILFTNSLRGNAVAKSVVSQQQFQKLQPFNDKLKVIQEGYTVAFQSTNKAYATTATFSSEMMAQTYMYEQINKNPVLKTAIHIVPNYELQENE